MNVYTPGRYDERVFHLALGIEPRDGNSGQRLTSSVDVRLERFPGPVDRWRAWRPGETLTGFLPRMHRHRTGRFARRYDEDRAGVPAQVDLRIVDDRRDGSLRVAGQGRTIVPRRVRIPVADESVVLAAEADPNQPAHPVWQRVFALSCFPGATAPLTSHSTVIRGQLVRMDPVAALVPVRWARVRATVGNTNQEVGWAHGDDRGEFVLVLTPPAGGVAIAPNPIPVRLTVGAVLPPAAPNPADPRLAEVDPLWDLPLEEITASATPDTEPSINGRRFLPIHSVFMPLNPPQPLDTPVGRELSVVIRIA